MFWTNILGDPNIESASMDGSNRTVIITDKVSNPSALAIDLPVRRLYFGDSHYNYIKFCNYDGSGVQEITSNVQV